MWGSKDSSIWLSLCCCTLKCQLLYITLAFSTVDLNTGKSIFVVLHLEHQGHDVHKATDKPDTWELTDESVEQPPLRGASEEKGRRGC